MDLKNLQLPDFLLADLYKSSLVELPNEATPKKQTTKITAQQWFLGENKKQVVIVVKDDEAVYLRDEWLNFLSSILSACKLNLGDTSIVNFNKTSCDYEALSEKLSPKFLLLFDVTAKEIQLPFTVPFYQVQQYNNCSFLMAPALENMLGTAQEAKLEKSKLWLSLKKMFNV